MSREDFLELKPGSRPKVVASPQHVLNAMATSSGDPLTVPAQRIPFLYPDGYSALTRERLMINMGLSPRKVWIDHSSGHWLHVITRNNPSALSSEDGMSRPRCAFEALASSRPSAR